MRHPVATVCGFVVLSCFAFLSSLSPARADEPAAPPAAAAPSAPASVDVGAALARHDEELARLRQELEAQAKAQKEAEARKLAELTFSGFLQADWVVHRQSSQDEINGSTGQPLNEDRFVLRRAHLRGVVERGLLWGALEIDANTVNGPIVRPIDAQVSLRWPETRDKERPYVEGSIGLLTIPFGFEVPELDYRRPFLERSAVMRAMFPGEHDLGLRIRGGYRALEYAVALMNGDPIGERLFPGRDPNQSKDLVARVGFDTELHERITVQGGLSAVTGTGFHKGTPSTKDVLVWRDVNEDGIVQSTEIQVIAGSAATPSQGFHRFALGADLRVAIRLPVIGALAVRAEVVRGANLDRAIEPADPAAVGRDLRETGWYLGATQEITPWGMIGVRYDRYDPDADASEGVAGNVVPRDRSYTTLAVMGALRYRGGRLVVEYDRNGNALGRTASGAPTTLKDDVLTLRGEVTF